jgi:glyoxylate/hydroxypyruvate reductase A
MMLNILYAGNPADWIQYSKHLRVAFNKVGLDCNLIQNAGDPADVDYIIYAPNGGLDDFTPFVNAKLVQSLWAGVEVPTANKTLTQPLSRMVEPGLSLGMADYVMGHVLRHHLGTDHFAAAKPGEWHGGLVPPLAQDRMVGILGLGALGMFCAQKLADFGFQTCGWSRSLKRDDRVGCFSGDDGLAQVLAQSDILVLLLPNTPETNGVVNAGAIAQMRDGVAIVNPGRGPLIDDDALLAALNSGKVSGATLDVFHVEPLPADHPYWVHPSVLVTPHIASATRTNTTSHVVAENIRRGQAGEPFLNIVDMQVGY